MIERVVELSLRHRAITIALACALALWGIHSLARTPIDAIPDLSENQVIVFADWMGHSPREVEDQITYPLSVNLKSLAGVKAVRATSEYDFSIVSMIFDDQVDPYFARQRVVERLASASGLLPPGITPYLAPDATALGQIFWYTVEGAGQDLGELRAVQDFYVRLQLSAVSGVAQVASVGGFIREYQIDVDPTRLRAHSLSVGDLYSAVSRSNGSAGGGVIEKNRSEYLVRGRGWITGPTDIESIVVANRGGIPIFIRDVAKVQVGPAPRRSMLEKDGGEAVGGVVIMRQGENPLAVTERIKAKIASLGAGLPPGVRIVPFYERTRLIHGAIETLRRTLIEEVLATAIAVFLVLYHLRSSLAIIAPMVCSVLTVFVLMHLFSLPSNIMSLAGIAISIGVLVDGGMVMTENAYSRLHEHFGGQQVQGDTRPMVLEACLAVARPIFFSTLIMVISFIPVFALSGTEGKMFRPLAWTKTFALLGVAVFSVTLVPALLPTFLRGRLRSEQESWVVRSVADVYRPVLRFFLDRPRWVWLSFALLIGLGVNLWPKLGREFMPPLDEGAILDMPVTVPGVSMPQATGDLVARDALLRTLPEVESVVGKVGRADTPFDPAPTEMMETIANLRPREHWPRRQLAFAEFMAAAAAALPAQAGGEVHAVATEAAARFDAGMRELSLGRLREREASLGRELLRGLAGDLVARAGASVVPAAIEAAVVSAAPHHAGPLGGPLSEEAVRAAADEVARALAAAHAVPEPAALLRDEATLGDLLLAPLRLLGARERPSLAARLLADARERRDRLLRTAVRELDRELEDRGSPLLAESIRGAATSRGHSSADAAPRSKPFLERKTKDALVVELDGIAQVPGWANIWTQPIVNRIDMLATGVRTMLGVKVYGAELGDIQRASNDIAAVLRGVPGAADVFPDQILGKGYIEVTPVRERAARFGIDNATIQDTIEVALGGKVITSTVEGRRRFPIRVRYARDYRQDEEAVRRLLVSGSGQPAALVPLAEVADVRVVQGPSMIKSENGLLCAYVQLNVRDRDISSFVEEARRVVQAQVKLPPGVFIEWSGQFEHQIRARRTLAVIFPLVILLIFAILYLTYRDLSDALLVMFAVPGALVGGMAFQVLFGFRFSVAAWVGYIACFGLAGQTGIIMLVYLRDALARAGGIEGVPSLAALKETVVKGAVQRLRPKLLTEGTAILGLLPMLWATGVGSEIIRPMAAPVLGGILVADEVIDLVLPVMFYLIRRRRWLRAHAQSG